MTHRVFGTPRGLLVSRIAVLVLALASSYFCLFSITFMWGPSGDIGINIDGATETVSYLAAQNAAKGIHLGDRIDVAAMPFPGRGYLYQEMFRPYGIRVPLPFFHDGRHRTVTLETRKLVPLDFSLDQTTHAWTYRIVALLFIATGVILVWNRPSAMLWGLAVSLFSAHDYVIGPFISPALAALEILAYAIVSALGLPGLIVFAARFPDGRMNRATKYWDALAAATFIYYFYSSVYRFISLFTARPVGDPQSDMQTMIVTSAGYLFVLVVLCAKLRRSNPSHSKGLGLIVAGYGVGVVVGYVGLNDLFYFIDFGSTWPQDGQLVVMFAMPASVAYSVIRYRAFGLGYFANKTLVYSALTVVVAFTFIICTWTASNYLHSTLGLGTAMFVAVLVGMAYQARRGGVIRFVDRIFLPHRYEAGMSIDRMRETLAGTRDAKQLADEVTATLGLASVAVFARDTDGGFVRKAACGWPPGTTWHLLPDEPLTRSLEAAATVIALPDDVDEELALPVAEARPRVALTFRRAGRVERAIFVGPYRNGTRLDRDAIRSLHGVFDQAIVA